MPYRAAQVYELVNDVASYPLFLPWCEAVRVEPAGAQALLATVTVKLSFMRFQLVTRNTQEPGRAIQMALVSGPFSHLSGAWGFEEQEAGCRVRFNIEYELRRIPLRKPLEVAFGRIAATFFDAFIEQARRRYG